MHCVTGHDRLLVLNVVPLSCLAFSWCHPEWIGIGVRKHLTEYYFLCVHMSYHVLLAYHFIVCLDSSLVKDGS